MTSEATEREPRRSPLALVVLALLAESPMHPYRMQRLIAERGKDRVVNIAQRNSIHQTLARLRREGLVEEMEEQYHQRRPRRIVYSITGTGRELLQRWMAEMLARPAREFPEFPAALSLLGLHSPEDVVARLGERANALERVVAELDAELERAQVPRVLLIEEEYRRAMAVAESDWVRSLIAEIESGTLWWDTVELLAWSRSTPDSGG
ncbi:PadR family transcriptional regulator [Haloechinothrix sp. LS1_15]|uniref:PadR family transcriptional regulator n=1 Tax=Haloechinothrix sp. LS1_15 TaxID=2652248 RepID=UPI0029479591|nr:PadR family transcriptional regulator [Haloechinothrix sp. LS1_15]MDV6011740.1 PadR family transcriptional regulator [Haloechinothrix sp. LS1_15]